MSTSRQVTHDALHGELAMWYVCRVLPSRKKDDFAGALQRISIALQEAQSDEEACHALFLLLKYAVRNQDPCTEIYCKAYRIACALGKSSVMAEV